MSKFDLTIDDIRFDPERLESLVRASVLSKLHRHTQLATVHTKTIDMSLVDMNGDLLRANSRDKIEHTSKLLFKVFDYAQDFVHSGKLIDIINNFGYTKHKSKGLTVSWTASDFTGYIEVNVDKYDALLESFATRVTNLEDPAFSMSSRYASYRFNDVRFTERYLGDPANPVLSRAVWLAKRDSLVESNDYMTVFGINSHTPTEQYPDAKFLHVHRVVADTNTVSLDIYLAGRGRVIRFLEFKPDSTTIRTYRSKLLEIQRDFVNSEAKLRETLSRESFAKFWTAIKDAKQVEADTDDAQLAWNTIPLAEAGTPASRTWGIEVETVHAERTSRPAGWEAKYDGSLESYDSESCTCECDGCYEYGEHCEDTDYGCPTGGGSCQEFVSPILDSFNSAGLRRLCHDIGAEETNTTPGIHVHVGAGDLTVTDVSRLLFAYGVVERFIKPLYHRSTYGYCRETPVNQIQHWLHSAKQWLTDYGQVPTPQDIVHSQPVDRYQDVNTQALIGHGTIEFRAMGPYYDYDHLVRWAWFVREMVNVSTLGLHQSVWLGCKSLADVIKVLRAYGKEAPLSKAPLGYSTSLLELVEA